MRRAIAGRCRATLPGVLLLAALLAGCAPAVTPISVGQSPAATDTATPPIDEPTLQPSPRPTAEPTPQPSPAPTSEPDPTPAASPADPPSTQAVAVAFWNRHRGLVGTVTYDGGEAVRGAILRTRDGGRTFTQVAEAPSPLVQVLTTGADEAWALSGCEVDGCTPQLLHSGDGGATWDARPTTLTWQSFPDPAHGWGVPGGSLEAGSGARFLRRTTDGGRTWTRVRTPCRGDAGDTGGLRALAFRSPTDGLAVCALTAGAGGELHAVLRTTDAGRRWTRLASTGGLKHPRPVGSIPYGGYIGGLVAAADGTTWMTGDRMAPLVAVDAGRRWRLLGLGDPDAVLVRAAWPLDARHGYAVVWDPELQATVLEVTRDGGRHWTRRATWPADYSE